MQYYTYILQCADGTFYIGMTKDLIWRLKQHNGLKAGGAKYTQYKRPVVLRYYERHDNHLLAARRERKLKQLTRSQKKVLCDSFTCVLP